MRPSSFIFKENNFFIEEDNHSDKVVMVEDVIDDIGNIMDLPRLMFIYEEYGNLKVVADSGKFPRNNNRKKSSEVMQSYRC